MNYNYKYKIFFKVTAKIARKLLDQDGHSMLIIGILFPGERKLINPMLDAPDFARLITKNIYKLF